MLSRATRGFFCSKAAFTSSEKRRVDDRVDRWRGEDKKEWRDTVNRLPARSVVGAAWRRELDDTARNMDEKEDRKRLLGTEN